MLFISVDREEIALPILDWLDDNDNIWKLFEERDRQPHNSLFTFTERHGNYFYDIINIVQRYNLESLNFLDIDMLEDGLGTILQNSELLSAIRSLTIVRDRLLDCSEPLTCLPIGYENSKEKMRIAFENSEADYKVNLNDCEESKGLFIFLKSFLFSMTDAVVNNKIFIYIKYTV